MLNKKIKVTLSMVILVIVVAVLIGLFWFVSNLKSIKDLGPSIPHRILNQSNDKNVTAGETNIIIGRSNATILNFGIRNGLDTTLNYKIKLTTFNGPQNAILPEFDNNFIYSAESFSLAPNDRDIRKIRLNIPQTAITGQYTTKVEVVNNDKNNV